MIGDLALALTLLSGAGLALHSFWNLTQVDLGVRTDHVLMFTLQQQDGRFRTAARIEPYYRQILERIHALPGVSSVAVVTGAPLLGTSDGMPFTIVGKSVSDPSQRPGSPFQSVTPEYFKTFGIRLIKGRVFTSSDTSSSPRVAMVNEQFVQQHLKGRDPLSTQLSIEQIDPTVQKLGAAVEWQIVGVFHNVRSLGCEEMRLKLMCRSPNHLCRAQQLACALQVNRPRSVRQSAGPCFHSIQMSACLI